MTSKFDHPRGIIPADQEVMTTVFVVNLCSRPDCEHPILFTSTDRTRAEERLRELVDQASEPDWRLDLYRIDTLFSNEEIFTPLMHVDAHGWTELGSAA